MGSERGHAEPEALLQVEISRLSIVFALLHVVLVAEGRPLAEAPEQEGGDGVSLEDAAPDRVLQHRQELEQ